MASQGGVVTPATQIDRQGRETGHLWPEFLPDGQHFLFLADGEQNTDHALKVAMLDRTDSNVLQKNFASRTIYASAGYLLYVDESLAARPFDVQRLAITGDEFRIAESGSVRQAADTDHFVAMSMSANNVLVYQQSPNTNSQLVWRDRSGRTLGTVGQPSDHEDPRISPDGRRLVFTGPDAQGRDWGLWILDLQQGAQTRVADHRGAIFAAVWSPDGEEVAFTATRPDGRIYRKSVREGPEQLVPVPGHNPMATDWSADGRKLIVNATSSGGDFDIWAVDVAGDLPTKPIVGTSNNETGGRISPDGRWLAYVSDESGTPEVNVRPWSGGGARQPISVKGGTEPVWRPDGKALFYLSADGYLKQVDLHQGLKGLMAGIPVPLFEARPTRGTYETVSIFNQRSYAVTPNGRQFLFNVLLNESLAFPLMVVVNWNASLPSIPN